MPTIGPLSGERKHIGVSEDLLLQSQKRSSARLGTGPGGTTSSRSTQFPCLTVVARKNVFIVYPEKFLRSISPLPDFKNRTEVRRWLDLMLAKVDRDMSIEEAKVLHTCCDTLRGLV
jgi:hypothetical protein